VPGPGPRRRLRAPAATLAAVVVAVGLAACGTDQSERGGSAGATDGAVPGATPASPADTPAARRAPAQVLAAVAEATAEQGSAHFNFSGQAAGAKVVGTGAFRLVGQNLAMSLRMRVPGEETNTQLVEGRIVGDALYLKLPAEDAPTGKPWLKISPEDDTPLAEGMRPFFEQLQQAADPTASLTLLGAATTVDEAGHATIDGVQTTRYDATVDLAKAMTAAKAPRAAQYRALLDAGVKRLDYSVWVDAEDLPRKFSSTLDTPRGPVTSEGTYTDWGQPVRVEAPPAARTTTVGELSR